MLNLKEKKGIAEVIASTIFYGTLPIFAKIIYQEGFSPFSALRNRFVIGSGIAILPFLLFYRKGIFIGFKNFIKVFLLSSSLSTFAPLMFFTSLKILDVSTAIFVFYTFPVFTGFFSFIIFKEKLQIKYFLALFLIILGLFLFVQFNIEINKGILFAFGASISFALYSVLNQHLLGSIDPFAISFYNIAMPGLIFYLIDKNKFIVYPVIFQKNVLLLNFLLLSIFSNLAVMLFIFGIKNIGARRASIINALEPFVAVLLAVFILKEGITINKVFGGILIIAGAILDNISIDFKNFSCLKRKT